MNKRVKPFVDLALEWKETGRSYYDIIVSLKEAGASYAIAFRTLGKMGFTEDQTEVLLAESKAWENERKSLLDQFFDFVETDDDLIE
ncbi:MAG: hypothetical protein HEP71_02055 [Roseivirga sp.]|nr:hypothetical protein [Roseivirga sp.]